MKLSRRDALLVLAGGGVVASTALGGDPTPDEEGTISDRQVGTLVSVSEVLYPSSVEPTREFVETFVTGRYRDRTDHLSGLSGSLTRLREASKRETGRSFSELSLSQREAVLRSTGADRAYPDPDGSTAQQIRHYVIDDLLYALYTTPKGGELVGNANPTGYAGGTDAYQEPPENE
jgi:hypothetical protein